jgi:predicted membrane-bound spermidine synthase
LGSNRALRVFLSSFLVLFIEVALIRWMPAYIRLLAYFSNFILLAAFLGIGVGCLLASTRARLFNWYPLVLFALVAVVYFFRLEVAIQTSGDIFFSSGTPQKVVTVESTYLLPVLFVIVAGLFAALAQRMAAEMSALPPLAAYTINILGSLAGVVAFAAMSWREAPPQYWFVLVLAASAPLLMQLEAGSKPRAAARLLQAVAVVLLAASALLVEQLAKDTIWSPYYKITVQKHDAETIVEVNNIFHQSMAPVDQKEYFYQWPYMVFGNTFQNVLILGAGSGTDVAAALKHGVQHVDAVEIDPVIIRLGKRWHPDRPYYDPRVTIINDDARHYLRTSQKKYDLVVFALIDSLTLQSSFSGVRLESYMFTQQSFQEVRDHLTDKGVLVIYNYFRERWLVDRLANTAAAAFHSEPYVHVHEERAFLGVLMAGPRLATLKEPPTIPPTVLAFGQSHDESPAHLLARDTSIEPATDDWPFLYMRERGIPSHYVAVIVMILAFSLVAVFGTLRLTGVKTDTRDPAARAVAAEFFFLGAGFMLLETKAITQFALLWGSTWVVASLAIASVLCMALIANVFVEHIEIKRPLLVGAVLVALLMVNYALPIGAVTLASRSLESAFYGALMFSPILCAGLLFGSAIKVSTSVARDYGTNLLGAMAGGVAEYLSLLTGFRVLLFVIAGCYIAAVVARHSIIRLRPRAAPARAL